MPRMFMPLRMYAVLSAMLFFFAGCSFVSGNAPPPAPAAEQENALEDDFVITYTAALDIQPETRLVNGVLKVSFKNKTSAPVNDVYFSLYLNAFRRGVRPKPYLESMEDKIFENGLDYGYIDIQNVTVYSEPLFYETYATTLKAALPEALPPGEETEVQLMFEAYVPKISHRTGANDFAVWFGNFLPQLCVLNESGWQTSAYYPVGDPAFSEIANYNVTINTPSNYTVAASGVEEYTEKDGGLQTVVNVRLVREFAFAVSERYIKTTLVTEQGTELSMYTYSSDVDTQAYLAALNDALDYYSGLISSYPYRRFDVAETGMFLSGSVEYPQLMFVDTHYLMTDAAIKNISHQAAHQWFYNIVGSNPVKEAWLDEGLCAFLSDMYTYTATELNERMRADYDRISELLKDLPNSSLTLRTSEFATLTDYYAVHYTRAKLMFYVLWRDMGEDAFTEFLRTYFNMAAYKIATKETLITAAQIVADTDLTEFFNDWVQNPKLPPLALF